VKGSQITTQTNTPPSCYKNQRQHHYNKHAKCPYKKIRVRKYPSLLPRSGRASNLKVKGSISQHHISVGGRIVGSISSPRIIRKKRSPLLTLPVAHISGMSQKSQHDTQMNPRIACTQEPAPSNLSRPFYRDLPKARQANCMRVI
jgi:hypothetical protein